VSLAEAGSWLGHSMTPCSPCAWASVMQKCSKDQRMGRYWCPVPSGLGYSAIPRNLEVFPGSHTRNSRETKDLHQVAQGVCGGAGFLIVNQDSRQPYLRGTGRARHAQWASCGLGKRGHHRGWCLSVQGAIIHYLLTQCPTCTCCRNSVCFNHIRKIALLLPKSISWRCCLHNIQGQILNKAISRVVLTLEKV